MTAATGGNLLFAGRWLSTSYYEILYPSVSAMALKTQCGCSLYLRQSAGRSLFAATSVYAIYGRA